MLPLYYRSHVMLDLHKLPACSSHPPRHRALLGAQQDNTWQEQHADCWGSREMHLNYHLNYHLNHHVSTIRCLVTAGTDERLSPHRPARGPHATPPRPARLRATPTDRVRASRARETPARAPRPRPPPRPSQWEDTAGRERDLLGDVAARDAREKLPPRGRGGVTWGSGAAPPPCGPFHRPPVGGGGGSRAEPPRLAGGGGASSGRSRDGRGAGRRQRERSGAGKRRAGAGAAAASFHRIATMARTLRALTFPLAVVSLACCLCGLAAIAAASDDHGEWVAPSPPLCSGSCWRGSPAPGPALWGAGRAPRPEPRRARPAALRGPDPPGRERRGAAGTRPDPPGAAPALAPPPLPGRRGRSPELLGRCPSCAALRPVIPGSLEGRAGARELCGGALVQLYRSVPAAACSWSRREPPLLVPGVFPHLPAARTLCALRQSLCRAENRGMCRGLQNAEAATKKTKSCLEAVRRSLATFRGGAGCSRGWRCPLTAAPAPADPVCRGAGVGHTAGAGAAPALPGLGWTRRSAATGEGTVGPAAQTPPVLPAFLLPCKGNIRIYPAQSQYSGFILGADVSFPRLKSWVRGIEVFFFFSEEQASADENWGTCCYPMQKNPLERFTVGGDFGTMSETLPQIPKLTAHWRKHLLILFSCETDPPC